MDWNPKAPWDLTEFGQETLPGSHGADGPNSYGIPSAKGDFSVDLKLGQMSNTVNEPVNMWKDSGVSKMASSPSGSSKRARSASGGGQAVHCLVDGCNADLSNCREYHRRHKVCEVHSKTPEVTINGRKQRFCQQCSRFHSLEEFDEGKRSCRKRLDGHNRRRRKPQPDPLSRSADILSSFRGPQLVSLSNSQVYPTTAVGNPTWAGVVNPEPEAALYARHQHLYGSSSSIYGGGKQIKFLQGHNPVLSSQMSAESSVCQQLPRTIVSSDSGGLGRNMFYDRLVSESDCALSLLSSPQMQTSGTNFSHLAHQNSHRGNHSLELLDSVRISSGSGRNTNSQGLFHLGSEGRQRNEASQVIPFHWD